MAVPPAEDAPPVLTANLPGPGRGRPKTPYRYRLTYRGGQDGEAGCVLLWEVSGGRLVYQIALERNGRGNLRLHCTCADAVFRAEEEGRFCKHVRGLLDHGRRAAAGAEPEDRLPA